MIDQPILTPYFLDEREAEMAELPKVLGDALPGGEWRVLKIDLPEGETTYRLGALYRALADEGRAAVDAGRRPVSIAGDCCATIGVLAGLQHAGLEPTLIWFDAHGDFNTWETTSSGFLGGMPLAMAVGLGEQSLLEGAGLRPWPENKVILTDGRDLDPGERENIARSAITHLPDVTRLLEPGGIPGGPLYVHFDVDILDPAEAPAMNYPAPGGPSATQLKQIFETLAATGRVAAISVSLWEPALDTDGQTEAVVQSVLRALFTKK
jgi:arginase